MNAVDINTDSFLLVLFKIKSHLLVCAGSADVRMARPQNSRVSDSILGM